MAPPAWQAAQGQWGPAWERCTETLVQPDGPGGGGRAGVHVDRVARLLCRRAVPAVGQAWGTPAPEGRGGSWPASSRVQCGKWVGEAASAAAGLRLAPHTCGTKGG